MELDNLVRKHFRLNNEDNLPFLASPPRSNRRKHGREMLAELLFELGCKKGVEIGTRAGGSAMIWCKYNPDMHLTCIDPWETYMNRRFGKNRQEKYYLKAVKNLSLLNVEIIRRRSLDVIDRFEDESLDFVHIDGNHEFDYCCPDIIYWSKKLKVGGIMAVHDYCTFHWNGVMKAVDAYTHCHHIDP